MSEGPKAIRPVPIGFSNTVVYDSRSVLFQYRVSDNGEKIPYGGHLSTWGGRHELSDVAGTNPRLQALRELREELPGLDGALAVNRLKRVGVYFLPLTERCSAGSHNVEGLVSEGYTGWVNWIYKLRVDDVGSLKASEGRAVVIPHKKVAKGDLPFPVMSGYDGIVEEVLFGKSSLLFSSCDLPGLRKYLEGMDVDMSAFSLYSSNSFAPKNDDSYQR